MKSRDSSGNFYVVGIFILLALPNQISLQDIDPSTCNCTTTESSVNFQSTDNLRLGEPKAPQYQHSREERFDYLKINKHLRDRQLENQSVSRESQANQEPSVRTHIQELEVLKVYPLNSDPRNQPNSTNSNRNSFDLNFDKQDPSTDTDKKQVGPNSNDDSAKIDPVAKLTPSETTDQTLNKYYDEKYLNRQLENQFSNRRYGDANADRRLEDEYVTRKHDTKKTSQYFDDQRYGKNFDDQYLTKIHDDEYANVRLDDQYRDRSLINRQQNRDPGDHHLSRNYDDPLTDENINGQHRNRNLVDQKYNRHIDEKIAGRELDDHHFRGNSDDQYSNTNFLNHQYNINFDDSYLNRKIYAQNSNRNYGDVNDRRDTNQQSVGRFKDKEYNKMIDHEQPVHFEDEKLENINDQRHNKDNSQNQDHERIEHKIKDFDGLQSNIHPVNQNFRRNDDNKDVIKMHSVTQYPERHFEDHYPDPHIEDLHSEKRLKDQIFEKHLIDQYPERRVKEQLLIGRVTETQPDKPRDVLLPERHMSDSNHERPFFDQKERDYLDVQFPSRRPEDSLTDRQIDSPNAEKTLLEHSTKPQLNDLHADRHLVDQSFERLKDDQQPGRQLGSDDLRPDRRLSDDNDDTYLGRNLNRHREDQSSGGESDEYPDRRYIGREDFDDYTTVGPRKESNISHFITYSREWEESRPRLNFPNKTGDARYRMASLHLDKGIFVFEFLRSFLSIIQPRNVPLDLLKDTLEGRMDITTLATKSLHLELVFIGVILAFTFLMFVLPGTECYLCCQPRKSKYKYRQHRGSSLFLLSIFTVILGTCMVTMLICNEEVASGIERIPETVEAALQDLRDYHAGTAVQLRKCVTRSLDVASEAVLADLDNVEELLGKPIQAQLSSETGVDVALEQLMDVANASTELAYKTDALLKRAERAREFSEELSRDAEEIRHELERTTRDCGPEDRSLCAVLDPSGLHLSLRLDRVARDDRLLRLRQTGRENLTELGRQARGEYLYVPHHIARTTLEARNKIRREINTARAKISDESRNIEASNSDLTNHLDQVRRTTNEVVPYIRRFEDTRWLVGFGATMCVLFIWLLLFGALCCRCGASGKKMRPTLLWFVFFSCLISMALWVVLMVTLTIASHTEMLLCRPLDDPEFRIIEAVLETRPFLGRRIGVPLKDLFERCEEKDAAYPAYQLDNNLKLESLTAHWTWTGLTRSFGKLSVDLTSLRILSPNLRERLQNLLYASGPNLTEHRIMIQGPILNKDLNGLSDQVENVARQLQDRRMARSFQTIAAQMRDLMSRRVKPLMKMQDELVYHLASLELHMHPLQRQVNNTLSQLRTVQYYIDTQGEKIGQIKTKAYVERLGNYLDQWRAHVLTEISTGVSKCRPLWDILRGMKLLFCSHILGPLNGFWFATFVCVVTMLISTPTAHKLAASYWGTQPSSKGSVLLPSRQGSPDTVVVDRDTWRTPDPPPSMDSW